MAEASSIVTINENARRRFEAAWHEGRPQAIEHFLPPQDQPNFLATLVELVHIELELAWKGWGETTGKAEEARARPPALEAYLARFAGLQQPGIVRRLLEQEYRVRHRYGDRPSSSEYCGRFPDLIVSGQEIERTLPDRGTLTDQYPQIPGYQILGFLGRGGMGVVYKARQISLNRVVALKMLLIEGGANEKDLARFHTEAEAVGRLQHSHIVQIHEVGQHRDRPYLALEFVEGGTLAQRLAGAPQPARPSAQFVETLARAMQTAHERGIVHRDLKPANILLQIPDCRLQNEAGQSSIFSLQSAIPKITDFGLAKLLDSEKGQTTTGAAIGTPSYMAPEQALGKTREIGPATDTYALGAILYELLTGRPPFRGETALSTLEQVRTQDPVPPSRLHPKVPRDLETICLKCLHKDPRRRYASASGLADELHRFVQSEPIQARPASFWERSLKWAKRRPATAALIAVSVLAAVSLLAGSLWHSTRLSAALGSAEQRRKEADRNLYHALVREAQAIRRARESGYRSAAWNRLDQALRIETADKDEAELRREAVACMGDFVGLEPTIWSDFEAPINRMALHPDSAQLALGLTNGTILVRNIVTGAQVARLREHHSLVNAIAFAPDGRRLISGDWTGTIKVWEADSAGAWVCRRTLEMDLQLRVLMPSAAFPFLVPLFRRAQITSVAVSPDGESLAACSWFGSTVSVWNLADGKRLADFQGHGGERIHNLAFHPEGELLAADYDKGQERGILLWDVAGRQLKPAVLPSFDVRQMVFSRDGRFLAVAESDQGLVLWNTTDFQRHLFLAGDALAGAAFSPDSRLVAVPAMQFELVRLWNVVSNREIAVLKHPGKPHLVEFSANGRALVTADNDAVRIWNLAGSEEKLVLSGHAGGTPGVAFSPDGKLLASAGKDRTVKIWDPGTGQLLHTLTGFADAVQAVAFSPEGQILASGDFAGAIRMWEVKTWQPLAALEHEPGSEVWTVAFAPSGAYFAACGYSLGVMLWRMDYRGANPGNGSELSLTKVARLSSRYTRNLCFSPDGQLLAWVDRRELDLHALDVANSRPHPVPPTRLLADVLSLAFLPPGKELAFIGRARVPEIWDLATGDRAFSFADMQAQGNTEAKGDSVIALSTDGSWLAQVGPAIRIWDCQHKRPLVDLPEERNAAWSLAWSPNKGLLAVGSSDGGLVIWNLVKIRSQLNAIGLGW